MRRRERAGAFVEVFVALCFGVFLAARWAGRPKYRQQEWVVAQPEDAQELALPLVLAAGAAAAATSADGGIGGGDGGIGGGIGGKCAETVGSTTGFNWRAYLRNYADLLQPPDSLDYSEQAARQHYETVGRAERRVATPLRLLLRFTAAGGLTNQLLAHLPAFMIAQELGAEVVVPAAVSRAGFQRGIKEWRFERVETLLNLDKMQAYWAQRGLVVHKTPELSAQQQEEYPRLIQHNHRATALYGDGGCASIVLPQPGRDLSTVVSHAHDRAVGVAEHVLQSSGAPPGCINLDTGNFFFRVTVSSAMHLAVSTLQGFFFNQTLVDLAAEIQQALGGPFHAVHLRVEDDAPWNLQLGGLAGAARAYVQAMKRARFKADTPVYVASGLLFEGSTSPVLDKIVKGMQAAGVAKRVSYKESLLGRERLQGLHSEQLALLDLLVMTRSTAFVGHPYSTFSVFLGELRTAAGFPPGSTRFLDMPVSKHAREQMDWFIRFAKGYKPVQRRHGASTGV